MTDLIAELLKNGIVDRSGQFTAELEHERVLRQGDEWARKQARTATRVKSSWRTISAICAERPPNGINRS